MKKLAALLFSVVLACTFLLAGCGDSTGKISGNYKEVTAEEFTATIDSIDDSKFFGDETAEDYMLQIAIAADFDVNLTFGNESMKNSVKADYTLSMGKSETDVVGKGSVAVKSDMMQLDLDVDAYNDATNIYFSGDLSMPNLELSLKNHLSYEALGELLGGLLGTTTTMSADVPTDTTTPEDPSTGTDTGDTLLLTLITSGALQMDTTKGVKIKVALDGEMLTALLADSIDVNFAFEKSGKAELYMYISEDGRLAEVAMNCSITGIIDMGTAKQGIEIKGAASAKFSDKRTVSLPSNLEDYPVFTAPAMPAL